MPDTAPLPGVLAEIADVAGRHIALEMALKLGGETFHVPQPRNLTQGHVLVDAIGMTAAAIVAEMCAGDQVYVPKARRALVCHLAAVGEGTPTIARRLGLSRRAVREYRRS